MIESSMAVILLAGCAWFILTNRRTSYLSNIQWLVNALRLRRDFFEARGDDKRAGELTDRADALSSGIGVISLSVPIEASAKREVELATMKAGQDDCLSGLGLTQHSLNYLPTKSALYWLGKKMKSK